MSKQIEFFLDVVSPYSYLAWKVLPGIAAQQGARVQWRPVLLGALLKSNGNNSPLAVPAKSRWMLDDLQQWARHYAVPFGLNPHFPLRTVELMRGLHACLQRDEALFLRHLEVLFQAMWVDGCNLADAGVLAAVLQQAGLDPLAFAALADSPEAREGLRLDTEQAVERGVFGAPSFIVDGQLFWGQDRLPFVEQAVRAAQPV